MGGGGGLPCSFPRPGRYCGAVLAPARRSSGGGPERVDGNGSGAEAARLTFFSLFRRLSGAPAASGGGSTADEGEGGVVGPTVRTATGILVPPATLRIIVEGGVHFSRHCFLLSVRQSLPDLVSQKSETRMSASVLKQDPNT